MPLTRDWSSSARLIPVRRRAQPGGHGAGVEGGLERVRRDVGDRPGEFGAAGHEGHVAERALVGEAQVRATVLKLNRIRTCGKAAGRARRPSSWPLMPRCASRPSSPADSHRYLPRRRARPGSARPARPRSRRPRPDGGARRAGAAPGRSRRCRRLTCRSRPRRTVSTSGSSGTRHRSRAGPDLPVVLVFPSLAVFLRPAISFSPVGPPADPATPPAARDRRTPP